MTIGIDEVGRGCWAGPLLIVAARAKAVLPTDLADSKLLSKMQREKLFKLITATCDIGEGWVHSVEIDKLGLAAAMRLGVSRALINLGASYEHEIVMDGSVNYCPEVFMKVQTIIKADRSHPIVSAASIFAKVKRDAHMKFIATLHPSYGFEKHVGYGTALHIEALRLHGVSNIHRKSFKPIKSFL